MPGTSTLRTGSNCVFSGPGPRPPEISVGSGCSAYHMHDMYQGHQVPSSAPRPRQSMRGWMARGRGRHGKQLRQRPVSTRFLSLARGCDWEGIHKLWNNCEGAK